MVRFLFIFFNMKVYCVCSSESLIEFIIKKKITPDYSKSAAMRFFS